MKMKNGKTFFTYFYQAEPAGRQVIPISASMRVSAAAQAPQSLSLHTPVDSGSNSRNYTILLGNFSFQTFPVKMETACCDPENYTLCLIKSSY